MQIEIASPYDKMAESGSSLLRLIQNNNTSRLDLLVRESIQNCLDAGNKRSKFVNVDFITGTANTERISRYFEQIEKNLTKRCGDKCDYIAIKDSNTVGLTGPIRIADIGEDGNYGNYLKLVTEISKPQDQSGAGGSWGLGKTVYFRIGIGLVVYYSRIKKENGKYESRLSAALVEDETKNDAILPGSKKLKRGIAWWGDLDKKDNSHVSTIPVTNEKRIADILADFGLGQFDDSETGTMIIIPFINREELLGETVPASQDADYKTPYWCKDNIEEYLNIAIQRWYAPRIHNELYQGQYLNVRINNKRITYSKMAPFFQLVQNLYNANRESQPEFNGKAISCKEIIVKNVFKKGNAKAGVISYIKVTSEDLKMLPPSNLPKPYYYIDMQGSDNLYNDPIVLCTRKPGMVVSYATTGEWTDSIPKTEPGEYIIGIFVANSANMLSQVEMSLEDYLRGSEKADHKAWDDWVISGGNPQIIQRIKRSVRKKIKDDFPAMTVGTEEKKNLGLGKMLADMLLPPTDFVYWDDARGGTTGLGGSGGVGQPASHSDATSSGSAHIILKQTGPLTFGDGVIVMPLRIMFGKKKAASIEIAVDAEGRTINRDEWEKTFDTDFPIKINGFRVTYAFKGKEEIVLIGDDTDVFTDQKIGGIDFKFEASEKNGNKFKMNINTDYADDYVIDGLLCYSISGVQGTLIMKEED